MNVKKQIKEYLILTFGTLLTAAGIYFFKVPNNFSTGGISGISVILSKLYPNLSFGTIMLLINIVLLVLGFIVIGKHFGFKTFYCSMLLSLSVYAFEFIFPMTKPFTGQPLLELVYAVLLPGIGSAIIFNYDGSTGGTDIVAMILKKYTYLNISTSLMCVDIFITLSTFAVFNVQVGLLSLLGLILRVLIIDKMIENINTSKYFTIITEEEEKITSYITDELHRSATISDACHGGYLGSDKKIIYTVLNRPQSIQLKKMIKSVDKSAFMIICNTSDIIGKGFRSSL